MQSNPSFLSSPHSLLLCRKAVAAPPRGACKLCKRGGHKPATCPLHRLLQAPPTPALHADAETERWAATRSDAMRRVLLCGAPRACTKCHTRRSHGAPAVQQLASAPLGLLKKPRAAKVSKRWSPKQLSAAEATLRAALLAQT